MSQIGNGFLQEMRHCRFGLMYFSLKWVAFDAAAYGAGACAGFIFGGANGGRYGSNYHRFIHYYGSGWGGQIAHVRCVDTTNDRHVKVHGLVCKQCGFVSVNRVLSDMDIVEWILLDKSRKKGRRGSMSLTDHINQLYRFNKLYHWCLICREYKVCNDVRKLVIQRGYLDEPYDHTDRHANHLTMLQRWNLFYSELEYPPIARMRLNVNFYTNDEWVQWLKVRVVIGIPILLFLWRVFQKT